MKFMKLGSRPDTFHSTESGRSVSSEVSCDVIVQVKGCKFFLHKFPLLSKCLRLQKLCSEASASASQVQLVQLHDFPGGVEAFEMCAKFCYAITITISAYNIVSIRCAAEYLQMTEDIEKGNLISKLESFFTSCILHGWRDSIVTLQSTKPFHLWSEDLGITPRCIDAIASRVLANPSKITLSHSYSRRGKDYASSNYASESHRNSKVSSSKGWWAEDLAELRIDLYWRTMIAVKSGGKFPSNLVGDALLIYASRWLPNLSSVYSKMEIEEKLAESGTELNTIGELPSKHRVLLESIVSLLPADKGAVSCSFLLKLLKVANLVKASSSSKTELARRIGLQLEEATLGDLLVPCLASVDGMKYDVDVVLTILEQFMLQGQSPPTSPPRTREPLLQERQRRSHSAENIDLEFQESRRSSSASHSSKLRVAKLVDAFLQEIAKDRKLPLSKFIAVADAIPGFARPYHDDLYKAIDIYLKGHPELNKTEKKELCRLLDCKRLSMEASMHAAQNEMLPLRVVVQVLFFEQARSTMASGQLTELPRNLKALLAGHMAQSLPKASFSTNATMPMDDQWSVSGLKSGSTNLSTLKMKLAEDDSFEINFHDGIENSSNLKSMSLSMIPNRSKGMLSKFWPISRSGGDKK
ncbi:BTB/POZ domain-containing protein At1g67900-like [Andrographis paniculata]|uniref:BTB/POZ domain-containing protein At1g67900-like n=1 Tax=Andrographis paniculata TaxID=175694 RepID=UPI0021E8F7FD|nr:BTB/POZ domain-containing protein At1g67900-like [Andrographis paniculata]